MKCLICSNEKSFHIERYPRMICNECTNSEYKDVDGNTVYFENEDIYGGFISIHTINSIKVKKTDHICFVNGIKCYADEARFGGIVIQVL